MKLAYTKDIILSKTVWAVIVLMTAALFGIIVPNQNLTNTQPETLRVISAVVVVIAALAAIVFRVKAENKLTPTSYDKHLGSMIILPILICCALALPACSNPETGNKYSPLEHARIAVDTLNKSYIPARTQYEVFYKEATPETQAMLNKNVNPAVNKATHALITVSALLVQWQSMNVMPDNYADALKEAEQAVPEAIDAIAKNLKNPQS